MEKKAKEQMLTHHLTQLIIDETEGLLEKWKHPDPYRAPTAPGGSKYERNLPVPSTERKFLASCLAKATITILDAVQLTRLAAPPHMHL